MIRAVAIAILTLCVAGCMSDGYDHSGNWGERNPAPNPAAGQVQSVAARQAMEARCKGEVAQKPGSPGTDARDYKCKDNFS